MSNHDFEEIVRHLKDDRDSNLDLIFTTNPGFLKRFKGFTLLGMTTGAVFGLFPGAMTDHFFQTIGDPGSQATPALTYGTMVIGQVIGGVIGASIGLPIAGAVTLTAATATGTKALYKKMKRLTHRANHTVVQTSVNRAPVEAPPAYDTLQPAYLVSNHIESDEALDVDLPPSYTVACNTI